MGGGQTQKQNVSTNQSGTSSFAPWAPTQPALSGIIQAAQGIPLNSTPLPAQQAGITGLVNTANNIAGFNPQIQANANFALGGGDAYAGIPGLKAATTAANNELSPYLGTSFLDPMTNPYLAPSLAGLQDQITQGVQSQFAGAGRYGAGGDETKALAMGLSEGLSPVLMNQFNTNAGLQQNAISQRFNNQLNLSDYQSQAANNALAAMIQGPSILGQQYNPYLTELQAGNQEASIPSQNLAGPAALISGLASLGGQSTQDMQGRSKGTATTSMSPFQTGLTGGLGLLGLLSMGQSGGLMGSLGTQLGAAL